MKLFGDKRSGNCLKVDYVATLLGLPLEWVPVDVMTGETRTPEFLAINPAGQVPVVVFGDGRSLAQSNAIMRYLARGSSLIPADPWLAAKMDEWLFWEQYSHETAIAVTRFQVAFKGRALADREPALVAKGEAVLDLMERHLGGKDWFVGDGLTLADIALVAYTQFAHEGGFSLEARPNVKTWVERVGAAIAAARGT